MKMQGIAEASNTLQFLFPVLPLPPTSPSWVMAKSCHACSWSTSEDSVCLMQTQGRESPYFQAAEIHRNWKIKF